MKQRRTYYAVVLDEYGGLLGVVTIRDLLEQLVGEIQQEGELPEIQPLEEGAWRIQGSGPPGRCGPNPGGRPAPGGV